MADIRSRVETYREEIKQCINDHFVLSNLRGIIEPDEMTRLKQLYDQNRPKATEQMLDFLKQSEEPGKWQHFIDALKLAEYPYLVYLLETSSRPSQNYDHEKNVIQIFYPYLAERIDPTEFVAHLHAAKVITMADMQAINSKHNNNGQQAGAIVLLEKIQCRQSPAVWYDKLLEVMMEMGHDDLVKEMEPDFYNSYKTAEQSGLRNNTNNMSPQNYSSVRENIVSDYGGPYAAADNLSPPDVDEFAQDSSVNVQGFASIDDSITHAKQKLYEMKLNIQVDESREPKPLNYPTVEENDESDEDFHDAVEDQGDNGTEAYNDLSRQTLVLDEINNSQQARLNDDEVDNDDDEYDSDENNLSSDDDFLLDDVQADQHLCLSHEAYYRFSLDKTNTTSLDIYVSGTDVDIFTIVHVPYTHPIRGESEGLNPADQLTLKLRNYQLELAENAVQRENTIICAETGSGKTWVALYIVKKHLELHPNGKVVFMARTGTLIKQQADRFKKCLPMHETILLTGDSENSSLLAQFMEGFQVFCMTPQILLNNLERNPDNSIHSFSMLIFDECHHAKKDEPYNKVMGVYLREKFEAPAVPLPQVIGLTASVGVGKSHSDVEARDYILSICANLDAKSLSTVERCTDELKKHVNLPIEKLIEMKARRDDPCKSILKMAIRNIEAKLEDLVVLKPSFVETMNACPGEKETQEYTKWTFELMKLAKLSNDDYEETRNISTCAKYLSVLNAAMEVNSLLRTVDVQKFLGDRLGGDLLDKSKLTAFETEILNSLTDDVKKMREYAKNIENPNVRLLSDTLRKMMEEKGEDSRAMVFVKTRATCKSLAQFLDKDLAGIGAKVSPLYGKENRDDEEGMTESRQNETVERFRTGDYKVLVATSVGSEGIDVPDCNIVLSYNYTGNEITKIQMSGRSRKRGGAAIVLGDKGIILQETINAYKASMMYRGMKLVKLLSRNDFDRKIRLLQRTELERVRFRKGIEDLVQSKRVDESVYEIKCGRCNAFACYSTDIRTLKGSQYIVVDKEFIKRIKIKPHRSPKKYEGMTKTSKMYCMRCPLDWGIVLDYKGLSCWTLKLACLKFVNTQTKLVTQYKKWLEVPFLPPEIEQEDLPKLFG